MSFAHWVNGSLCPLLQRTDQHSAGLARLQIKTEGRGLANETKVSFVCMYQHCPWGEGDSIYQVDPYKGARKSKLSYCVARETRTLLNSSFHYHLFSHRKIKKKQTPKSKITTHWSRPHYKSKHWCGISVERRKLVKTPQSHKKVFQFNCLCLSILIYHPRPSILD